MALFMTVLIIAAQTFNTVITLSKKYSKSEESNIEGIIGLEVLRHDLEQMGFGLYWGYLPGSGITYGELTDASDATNDAPSNVPRACVFRNNSAAFLSDMIGVKGTTVGRAKPSQLWTYISFHNVSSSSSWSSLPIKWPAKNLKSAPNPDKVIAVRHNFNDSSDDHLLLLDSSGKFEFDFNSNGSIPVMYLPTKDQQVSMVYGVGSYDASTPLRMPFNRSDFFISTSSVPKFCAVRTGVLEKATVSHGNGGYNYIPLLDCVADMQVVLGWDVSNGGNAKSISAYSNADGSSVNGDATFSDVQGWLASPLGIREHLKIIKVYILAQEGRKDPKYLYPAASMVVGNEYNGETPLTKTYTFTTAQLQYHWKLYRVIVKPKNLANNQ